VVAVRAVSSWAVGGTYRPEPVGTTLILRWNGAAWK
jgi:hypothetical protein